MAITEYDDYCYECTGYGDDYSFINGEWIRNCDKCFHNSCGGESDDTLD